MPDASIIFQRRKPFSNRSAPFCNLQLRGPLQRRFEFACAPIALPAPPAIFAHAFLWKIRVTGDQQYV
jgi:hypothetical protein